MYTKIEVDGNKMREELVDKILGPRNDMPEEDKGNTNQTTTLSVPDNELVLFSHWRSQHIGLGAARGHWIASDGWNADTSTTFSIWSDGIRFR